MGMLSRAEIMLLEKETHPPRLARIPLHTPLGSSLEVGVMYVAHPKWVVHSMLFP